MGHLGQVAWNKGLKLGPQSKELIEKRIAPRRGKKLGPMTSQTKEKLSNIAKQQWENPEAKEKARNTTKKLWKNPEFIKKWSESCLIKPNKSELKLENILNNLQPNEWKYVGNFKFWIEGKNPDFLNINGKKKLIELFGSYWHKEKDEQERINHFKKYGFDTLVIWEKELKNKEKIIEKITNFLEM